MAEAFVSTVIIDAPVETVWDRLTDWERAGDWMSGVDELHATGPLSAGTVLEFRGRGKSRRSLISGITPGRSITLVSRQGRVTATYTYLCERSGARTRVDLVADCTATGPMTLIGPLVRAAIRRADQGQLRELKKLVEAPT